MPTKTFELISFIQNVSLIFTAMRRKIAHRGTSLHNRKKTHFYPGFQNQKDITRFPVTHQYTLEKEAPWKPELKF